MSKVQCFYIGRPLAEASQLGNGYGWWKRWWRRKRCEVLKFQLTSKLLFDRLMYAMGMVREHSEEKVT